MKSGYNEAGASTTVSLSSWRAWIEIVILKMMKPVSNGRSPHGERGLKFLAGGRQSRVRMSLSSWRAWIEIESQLNGTSMYYVALLMESVD